MRVAFCAALLAFALASVARAGCGVHGCGTEIDELAPCADVVAIVECEHGGVSIADFRVIDGIRGVETGSRLRAYYFTPGPEFSAPRVLPGTRLLLAATRTPPWRSQNLRHFAEPRKDGLLEVAALAAEDVHQRVYALTGAGPLSEEVRKYLALSPEDQRDRRITARMTDHVACTSFPPKDDEPARQDVCRRFAAATTPAERMAIFQAVPDFHTAWDTERIVTETNACRRVLAWQEKEIIPPEYAKYRERRDRAWAAVLRDETAAATGYFGKVADVVRTRRALRAASSAKERDRLLTRLLDAKSESVRAEAALFAKESGRPGPEAALWAKVRDHEGFVTTHLAFARARAGDKAAADVLVERCFTTEGHDSAGQRALRVEASVLLANSAWKAGISRCRALEDSPRPRCLETLDDGAEWIAWWRWHRDEMKLVDAWPDLEDVPFWGLPGL